MATLDSAPGAGILVDREHTIVEMNNRCTVVFAEELAELCNESLRAVQRRGSSRNRPADGGKRRCRRQSTGKR